MKGISGLIGYAGLALALGAGDGLYADDSSKGYGISEFNLTLRTGEPEEPFARIAMAPPLPQPPANTPAVPEPATVGLAALALGGAAVAAGRRPRD